MSLCSPPKTKKSRGPKNEAPMSPVAPVFIDFVTRFV